MFGIGLFTVETVMVFGIGFLTATLVTLATFPAVHNRAVRLTRRRIDATIPLSVKEMYAEKDALRGKFAAATAQLETSIDSLKAKTVAHTTELVRKNELVNRMKATLDERAATIAALEIREKALETREKELWDELNVARSDVTTRNGALQDAERTIAVLRLELSGLTAAGATREKELLDRLRATNNEIAATSGALHDAERTSALMRSEMSSLAAAAAAAEERRRMIDHQQNEIAALATRSVRPVMPQAWPAPEPLREVRPAQPRPLPVAPAAEVRNAEPRVAPAPTPVASNVHEFEPRSTAEWLEYGKAKLRNGQGNGQGGATRVPYEQSANGVLPI